jgi:C1A family cysteine protease
MEPQFTFQIGRTALMDQHLFGAILPPVAILKRDAILQHAVNTTNSLVLPQQAAPLPPFFDWLSQNRVTSVKCQWGNDCWAFASTADLESAIMIAENTSQEPNLSEQQVIDCTAAGTYAKGGWWGPVFAYFETNGITDENTCPYAHQDGPCQQLNGPPYFVKNWDFVSPDGTDSTVNQLKHAIADHGPIVAGIVASNLFESYTNGVFNELTNCTLSVNHAILIIGWDDSKMAWHVKNSWGSCDGCWGQNGLGWVAYGANRIGYNAAWVEMKKP